MGTVAVLVVLMVVLVGMVGCYQSLLKPEILVPAKCPIPTISLKRLDMKVVVALAGSRTRMRVELAVVLSGSQLQAPSI